MFKNYEKKGITAIRDYVPGEDMEGRSLSPGDTLCIGGKIACNPDKPEDSWYINEEYFKDNYSLVEDCENSSGLSFGLAIEALKKGLKVCREGWNGKGMWLSIIHAGNAMHLSYPMQDCIGMKTANELMQPGWLASQADMLADDWTIVE